MPRARKPSDDTYNARRRAKRLIARLERDLQAAKGSAAALGKRAARSTASFIGALREQVEASYVGRRGSRTVGMEQEAAADRLRRMASANLRDRQARANEVFRRELAMARSDAPSSLGRRGGDLVKVFYRATQQIWEGRPPAERNAAIMEALGVDDLESAFWQVIRENREALRVAMDPDSDTPGSPPEWMVYVNPVYHR